MTGHPFDDRHDIMVVVTIRDSVTGKTHTTAGFSTWWWTNGNGSCDCNRWPPDENGAIARGGEACVCKRFRIVAVEPLLPGYTIDDFNGDYYPGVDGGSG